MSTYSNSTFEEKAKKCIEIVRNHLGEPTNKLSRYNENAELEAGKFYVVSKERKLSLLRDGHIDTANKEKYLANILELKSGNCGEYGVYTDILLRLKGFKTYQVVEDYGDDNHCYSLVKFDGYYWIVDAWHNMVEKFGTNMPTENNAVCTPTSAGKLPLTKEYWNTDLYDNLKAEAVGKSSALSKITSLTTTWK
ncbi:MAG: transglutaminase-like domain-containing protein [Rhodothermaceae bacterium]